MYNKRLAAWLCSIAMLATFFCSCVNTRSATYFNGVQNSQAASVSVPESLIQQNDILGITVSSLNPEATVIFNPPVIPNQSTPYNGYLVNADGSIQFPVLGNVMAAGLTKDELKAKLVKNFLDKKLLIDPIVVVRFLNFRVTVLGEVARPSVVNVPSERISLLEAIGSAGDLTIYAKRNNVLVIREENGVKTLQRLDLNSSELFTSPYYYLKTNDVVYVEPNKAKVASAGRANQALPIILGGLSLAIIVADRIFR